MPEDGAVFAGDLVDAGCVTGRDEIIAIFVLVDGVDVAVELVSYDILKG